MKNEALHSLSRSFADLGVAINLGEAVKLKNGVYRPTTAKLGFFGRIVSWWQGDNLKTRISVEKLFIDFFGVEEGRRMLGASKIKIISNKPLKSHQLEMALNSAKDRFAINNGKKRLEKLENELNKIHIYSSDELFDLSGALRSGEFIDIVAENAKNKCDSRRIMRKINEVQKNVRIQEKALEKSSGAIKSQYVEANNLKFPEPGEIIDHYLSHP